MWSLAWPWMMLALPLPWIVRALMPPVVGTQDAGLRVPSFKGFSMLADRSEVEQLLPRAGQSAVWHQSTRAIDAWSRWTRRPAFPIRHSATAARSR